MFRRIWYLLNRARLERELEEEMAAHRAQLNPGDRAAFGSSLRLREQARDAWGWAWLDALAQDVRFACRTLPRAAGFTAATVSVLALGIAVALTAFQVFNALVLRPLPIRAPDNLYMLQRRGPESLSSVLSYPEYEFVRAHNRPLSAVLAQMEIEAQIGPHGETRAAARFVSSNYLAELGAGPAWGRLFGPSDAAPGAPAVAVLGYAFWQRQFQSNPRAVGQTIYVEGRPATIVGVAAPGSHGAPGGFHGIGWTPVDLWLPIEQHASFFPNSGLLRDAHKRPLRIFARLRPSFTKASAEQSLRPLAQEFLRVYPGAGGASQWLECEPAGRAMRLSGRDYEPLMFFAALVALVVAVSLSNAGALQLSRGAVRARELWIRGALGAGRFRLARQLITEALLTALAASGAGLLLSYWGTTAVLRSLETPLSPALDWRCGAALLTLTLLSATFCGAVPAFQAFRRRTRPSRLRGFLLGTQVMASCVLLIAAGLYARGLQRALYAPLGFEYRNVVAIAPGFGARGYSPERARAALEEIRLAAQATPGAVSVALCAKEPLSPGQWIEGVRGASGQYVMAQSNSVGPGFFDAMQISILGGRAFRAEERNAAIVSQSLAQRAWPGENPLGKLLEDGKQVVGVAASARTSALSDGDAVEIYFPFAGEQQQVSEAVALVRTAGPPQTWLPALRAAVAQLETQRPRFDLLTDRFNEATSRTRKGAAVIGFTAALTLAIAAMGLAGLLSQAVSQRTREIGIRVALGARPTGIVRTVLAQAARPVACGLLAGAAAGYAVSSLMRSQIYGVGRLDPPTYLAALALLLAAAFTAAVFPIARALRVNVVSALRHE